MRNQKENHTKEETQERSINQKDSSFDALSFHTKTFKIPLGTNDLQTFWKLPSRRSAKV